MVTVALVLALAVLVARHGSPAAARRRLGTVIVRPPGVAPVRPRRPAWAGRALGAGGVGLALATFVGGSFGLGAAVLGAIVSWSALSRLESAATRRSRQQVRRDLPFAADLVATCLSAGATPAQSFAVVGAAVGDVLGEAFARAASVLELGAPVLEAVAPWREDPALVDLEPLARVFARAEASGTGLAEAAERLAADLRSERRWRVDEVARRAGVRATAPLGACFLPAFVLLGVAPVVLWSTRSLTA